MESKFKDDESITVRQLTALCNVTPRMVRQWFKSGLEHWERAGTPYTTWGAVKRFARKRDEQEGPNPPAAPSEPRYGTCQ